MTISVERTRDPAYVAGFASQIMSALPMWFGRPESNAAYSTGMTSRDCFLARVEGRNAGLIALEYQFSSTCNVWWLGVLPDRHRRGIGRALLGRAEDEARRRGLATMAVLTMGPGEESAEYARTRRFYEATGFRPFVEFEPEPGDFMMWMAKSL